MWIQFALSNKRVDFAALPHRVCVYVYHVVTCIIYIYIFINRSNTIILCKHHLLGNPATLSLRVLGTFKFDSHRNARRKGSHGWHCFRKPRNIPEAMSRLWNANVWIHTCFRLKSRMVYLLDTLKIKEMHCRFTINIWCCWSDSS